MKGGCVYLATGQYRVGCWGGKPANHQPYINNIIEFTPACQEIHHNFEIGRICKTIIPSLFILASYFKMS